VLHSLHQDGSLPDHLRSKASQAALEQAVRLLETLQLIGREPATPEQADQIWLTTRGRQLVQLLTNAASPPTPRSTGD
jgi:hypothetical protein